MLFGEIFPFFAMNVLLNKIIEPKNQIKEEQKVFSNHALKIMLIPLFMEQLLSVLVGVADTFMVSYAGEAAVSGVSLVNMFNTVFLFLFSALAAGGSVVVSQYIGSREKEKRTYRKDRKNKALTSFQKGTRRNVKLSLVPFRL